MWSKKILNILIYISVILVLFIGFDFCYTRFQFNQFVNQVYDSDEKKKYSPKFNYSLRTIPFKDYWLRNEEDFYCLNKKYLGYDKKKEKPPIILFGCSFADGAFLRYNQTFGYKLSQLTNRTVDNRAYGGLGPGTMVWQTKSEDLYKYINADYPEVSMQPEYAIYIFISDHFLRIYNDKFGGPIYSKVTIGYDFTNDGLKESNSFLIWLCRFTCIKLPIQNFYDRQSVDAHSGLFKAYITESRKELQKRYPNMKFIIIKHPIDEQHYNNPVYNCKVWEELKNEGFIIYDLKKEADIDIMSEQYALPDKHPNEAAWDAVTPKFVKDLNL